MAFKVLSLALSLALFATTCHSQGYNYVAYKRSLPFFQAWQTCLLYGGNLASIQSADDNARVVAAIELKGEVWRSWFIGGTDVGYEGRFMWIGLNKEIGGTSYKNYYPGEPNDAGGNEDCLAMGGGNKWNDLPCDKGVSGFVCAFKQ